MFQSTALYPEKTTVTILYYFPNKYSYSLVTLSQSFTAMFRVATSRCLHPHNLLLLFCPCPHKHLILPFTLYHQTHSVSFYIEWLFGISLNKQIKNIILPHNYHQLLPVTTSYYAGYRTINTIL